MNCIIVAVQRLNSSVALQLPVELAQTTIGCCTGVCAVELHEPFLERYKKGMANLGACLRSAQDSNVIREHANMVPIGSFVCRCMYRGTCTSPSQSSTTGRA